MPKRIVKSVYFRYRTEKGTYTTARKGETVDIPEGAYLERGDKLGALESVKAAAQPQAPTPPPGDPGTSPVNAELDAALGGSVKDLLAYAEQNPDAAQALLDGEQAKAEPRVTAVEGLAKLLEA